MNQEKAAYMSIRTLTAVFILSALCQSSVNSNTFDEERIGFTVPAAPWTLTLPKDQLVVVQQQIKPDGRSGYFYMNDEKNKLNISFFIEPVKDCKDSKACRDMVWKAGNPMWENPQNVVLSEIGDVSYFEFFMPSLQGVPSEQQNMYAEFVKDGFWVDLHISKVHYKPEEHELFERIIKSVKFEPKGTPPQRQDFQPGQKPEEVARKVAEAWLALLDSGEYAESWEELSPVVKEMQTERGMPKGRWVAAMMSLRKQHLGKLTSRKFVEARFMKSLPGRPDHEGATVQFESDFENRQDVLESVAVIHDKDGKWRVALYLTNWP